MVGSYLPEGLPQPTPDADGLYAPFWEGLQQDRLVVQQNPKSGAYQWPPQWIALDTQTFGLDWVEIEPRGEIYAWTRVWHPAHEALAGAGPYLVVIVELPDAGRIRMVGNLLGDPLQAVRIGATVEGSFEHHGGPAPYSLLQWAVVGGESTP